MLWIFGLPVIGLALAFIINLIFPRAQFRGYDVLPVFFIAACSLITIYRNIPSFLPYGFLIYFVLAILISVKSAIKNKNISLGKTFRKLWNYLAMSTLLWYVGLVIVLFVI